MKNSLKTGLIGLLLSTLIGFGSYAGATVVTGGDSGYEETTTSSPVTGVTGTVNFDWSYHTEDWNSSYDPAGYFVNNTFTQLTDDSGANDQSGSVFFNVVASDSFGFYVYSVDGAEGAATMTFNETSTVPEPSSIALLGLGLVGFAAMRKRKTV